jgi:hypothetical protein
MRAHVGGTVVGDTTNDYLRAFSATDGDGMHLPRPFIAIYGDHIIPRPFFVNSQVLTRTAADLTTVLDLLQTLPDRLFDGDLVRYRTAVGMPPHSAALAGHRHSALPIGRADLYHDGETFRLLEFNVGSAIGGMELSELAKAQLSNDHFAAFAVRHELEFVDTFAAIARHLRSLDVLNGDHRSAVVGLVDCPSAFPAYGKLYRYWAELLGSHGFEVVIGDVCQLGYRNRRVFLDSKPVDYVYRLFTVGGAVRELGDTTAVDELVRAHDDGQVNMVSPIIDDLYGNKCALAMLSDDRNRSEFSTAELAAVDRILPMTRSLTSDTISVDGTEADTLDYCLAHKNNLFMKPGAGSLGFGAVPGWAVTTPEWEAALSANLGRPVIVQHRVRPRPEPVVGAATGQSTDWWLNWGVFIAAGAFGGCEASLIKQRRPRVNPC